MGSVDLLNWVLNSMGSTLVRNLQVIQCNRTLVHIFCRKYVVLLQESFPTSQVNIILKHFKQPSLHLCQNTHTRYDGILSIDSLGELHVEWRNADQWSTIPLQPPLTHVHIKYIRRFSQIFWQQVHNGNLRCLTHLSVIGCHGIKEKICFMFESGLSKLKYLSLLKTNLGESDLKSLCLACNGKKKTLPNLTSLSLSLPDHISSKTVTENLFLCPWLSLEQLYMYWSGNCKANAKECLSYAMKGAALSNLKSFGIQNTSLDAPIPSQSDFFLKKMYVWWQHYSLEQKTVNFFTNLSTLSLRSCKDITGSLSRVLSRESISLDTLVLNNCKLNGEDLSHLAQSSVKGKLPKLKHLDLSDNKMTVSELMCLFDFECKWERLISFEIRRTLYDNYYVQDFVQKLMICVMADGLCSLQHLGIDSLPCVNTRWSTLKVLFLPRCTEETLSKIKHVVAQGNLPALRSVCIEKWEECDASLGNYFSERNIHCHQTCSPFDDPLSNVKFYRQME